MSNYSRQGPHDLGLFPYAPHGALCPSQSQLCLVLEIALRSLPQLLLRPGTLYPIFYLPISTPAYLTGRSWWGPFFQHSIPSSLPPSNRYSFGYLAYADSVRAGPGPVEFCEETVSPHLHVDWGFSSVLAWYPGLIWQPLLYSVPWHPGYVSACYIIGSRR